MLQTFYDPLISSILLRHFLLEYKGVCFPQFVPVTQPGNMLSETLPISVSTHKSVSQKNSKWQFPGSLSHIPLYFIVETSSAIWMFPATWVKQLHRRGRRRRLFELSALGAGSLSSPTESEYTVRTRSRKAPWHWNKSQCLNFISYLTQQATHTWDLGSSGII